MASKGQQNFGNRGQNVGQHEAGSSHQSVGEMASAVKDKAQDIASSVAETAGDAWDGTREQVQRAAGAVADTAGDAWGEVTGLMRRYPFGTLFVGIGVGFVLAQILQPRTDSLRRMGSDVVDRMRDYASDAVSRLQS